MITKEEVQKYLESRYPAEVVTRYFEYLEEEYLLPPAEADLAGMSEERRADFARYDEFRTPEALDEDVKYLIGCGWGAT